MPLGLDDHIDLGTSLEAVGLNIPSRLSENVVTSGGQTGECGHLTAGDEPDPGVAGKVEKLQNPTGCDLLGHCDSGSDRVQTGVLIPRGSEQFGPVRSRMETADDEPEVAAGSMSDNERFEIFGQSRHDVLGAGARLGKRSADQRPDLLRVGRPVHGSVGQRLEISDSRTNGRFDDLLPIRLLHVHPPAKVKP